MSSDSPQANPVVDAHNGDSADSRATASTLTRQGSDDADDAPKRPLSQEASLNTDTAGDQGSTALTTKESASDNDPWQAVFSAEANAWYFWNAQTNETTWSNPHQSSSGTGDATTDPGVRADLPAAATSREKEEEGGLPPIDPDLAWLDPSAARVGAARAVTQTARFNARTGRFQADPSRNPDRISDFQRGQRQQEAYYDVRGWESTLAGQGLKRSDDSTPEGERKRPSAKELERFRQAKENKKRRKIASWLPS